MSVPFLSFAINAVLLLSTATTFFGSSVLGDIYMHNPRGSNNRLDEEGRARNNANRMFDSQNNDRGGYNVGGLYYYQGSVLPIEWTNQHECGGPNSHCELIIQYMCSDTLRDGATTTTIPDNPAQCENYNCNTDLRYGMHEDFNHYTDCKLRQRNEELFTADQNLNGDAAIYTRQNPAGTRRGYECPEERDYYPYWHPTPWRDIAVMTNSAERCAMYQQESENVKSRYHCVVPYAVKVKGANSIKIPNNKEDCEALELPAAMANGSKPEWKESPSHGIPAPVCQEAEFSRDNHLGNGANGYPNLFNWTLPEDAVGENCAIRIRYNISTGEFNGWDGSTDASLNEQEDGEGSDVDLSARYGFADIEAAKERGYVLENNPQVDIFDDDKLDLQLAINTAQFGRTFQDRSHSFAIRAPPADLEGAMIHNLNVRGKRGNIVQVYPAVEYDFVPNVLEAAVGDYVHIQWTGSNTNPKNNDGQGLAGTDRSNLVLQEERVYLENSGSYWQGTDKLGHWGRSYPENLDDASLLGLTREDREFLALLTPGQFRGEMSELDDAGTYYDLGPKKITEAGTAHYMCTRNNNFSNRSQKGKLVVSAHPIASGQIGVRGGRISLPDQSAVVDAGENVFEGLTYITIQQWPSDVGEEKIKDAGQTLDVGSTYASHFVVISPEEQITMDSKVFKVEMQLHNDSTKNVKIYRSNSAHFSSWQEVDANIQDNRAVFETNGGGVYVARNGSNIGVIVGVTVAAVLVLVIIIATVIYFRMKPDKAEAVRQRFRNMKRGTQAKV